MPGSSTYRAAFGAAQDRPDRRKPTIAIRPTGIALCLVTIEDDFVETASYAGRRAALRHAIQEKVNSCE